MRYTIVTGPQPGHYGVDYAHYYFPSYTHQLMIPYLWQAPYLTTGPHSIQHVYYFR
ncbi:hypothetical protein [Bacillus sp. J37]|uniref:hypothetical protein n=1 Tax=Bacillus sp. J37 TaxID=935837 RepID=UPI0004B49955|nr:hypothetical protein [Bacillus sp. J37]